MENRRGFFGMLAAAGLTTTAAIAGVPEPESIQNQEIGEEGDEFFVLNYPGKLSNQAQANIKRSWEQLFNDHGHKAPICIVLEEGMTLQKARLPKQG